MSIKSEIKEYPEEVHNLHDEADCVMIELAQISQEIEIYAAALQNRKRDVRDLVCEKLYALKEEIAALSRRIDVANTLVEV